MRKLTDKLFGGIDMKWWKVIVFAVTTAVISAAVLILPIFDNTSFREIGVSYEAWIFFAVIIMTNCKKPLESALKVFVFFLISQPLIYLFQVPFSEMGFGLFGYYSFWFVLTLFTFPVAFVGWYVKKGNWLSLLMLAPIFLLLVMFGFGYAKSYLIHNPPSHLLAVLFCFGQIALYLYAFFTDKKKIIVGAAVAVVAVILLLIFASSISLGVSMPLPDEPSFSDSAVLTIADESFGTGEITVPEEGYVSLQFGKTGDTYMTITDGDKVYLYDLHIYFDEGGHPQVDVTPAGAK
jgi:hypothetical protein